MRLPESSSLVRHFSWTITTGFGGLLMGKSCTVDSFLQYVYMYEAATAQTSPCYSLKLPPKSVYVRPLMARNPYAEGVKVMA